MTHALDIEQSASLQCSGATKREITTYMCRFMHTLSMHLLTRVRALTSSFAGTAAAAGRVKCFTLLYSTSTLRVSLSLSISVDHSFSLSFSLSRSQCSLPQQPPTPRHQTRVLRAVPHPTPHQYLPHAILCRPSLAAHSH